MRLQKPVTYRTDSLEHAMKIVCNNCPTWWGGDDPAKCRKEGRYCKTIREICYSHFENNPRIGVLKR